MNRRSRLIETTKDNSVKVAVPISSINEAESLASHGADEFYCGFTPKEWTERYSYAVPINRRLNERANFSSFDELAALVKKAHAYGSTVFVTFNAPYYTDPQIDYLIELIKKLYVIGVDGIIVCDIGLILSIKESGIEIDINLSSLASVYNHEAAIFYAELGVKRIIFPRHITLKEIREIKKAAPEIEYEAFILNDACVYGEGFCNTTHKVGPFCTTNWQYDFLKTDASPLSSHDEESLARNLNDYKEWTWYMNNCGSSISPNGTPNGACGLCAIHSLSISGITALKIVGREATLDRKLKSLIMVKNVLKQVVAGSEKSVRRFAREMRSTPELCDSGYMCYYRDTSRSKKAL